MEVVASLNDLPKLAEEVLRLKGNRTFIAFYGDLGAGKTTLIKIICNFLHVNDAVSSPTFSLVNEYQNNEGGSIFHFDFYRIKNEVEALDMGCEEYFESGNLCLVEWPEKIPNLLPENRLEVHIDADENERKFTIKQYNQCQMM